ncbi:MAG: hypothetical protein GY720_19835 [bacterium]|nr:hypothetical protein [bacterium]
MFEPILSYLDPGTGATLLQLALAGTAGIAAASKMRMNKIKRRLNRDEEAEPVQAEGHVEEPTSTQ